MPLVQITMIEGREDAAIQNCMKRIAHTIHETLGAPIETVRIIVNQVPSKQWMVGDRTREEIDREKMAKGGA
ncbi:MAG TPA: tautomerase family protein [Stellaceae bacterium]|jgi:4-oxalocrotonate tautomerase|nr:tautomerase family protein [Stellaceae bacterium]